MYFGGRKSFVGSCPSGDFRSTPTPGHLRGGRHPGPGDGGPGSSRSMIYHLAAPGFVTRSLHLHHSTSHPMLPHITPSLSLSLSLLLSLLLSLFLALSLCLSLSLSLSLSRSFCPFAHVTYTSDLICQSLSLSISLSLPLSPSLRLTCLYPDLHVYLCLHIPTSLYG